MNMLLQVDTGYACAGVVVNGDGIIVDAAPIFRWMKGKAWSSVKHWRNIRSVTRVPEREDPYPKRGPAPGLIPSGNVAYSATLATCNKQPFKPDNAL